MNGDPRHDHPRSAPRPIRASPRRPRAPRPGIYQPCLQKGLATLYAISTRCRRTRRQRLGLDQHLNAAPVFQARSGRGIDRVEEVLFFEYDLRNHERLGFGKELVKLERFALPCRPTIRWPDEAIRLVDPSTPGRNGGDEFVRFLSIFQDVTNTTTRSTTCRTLHPAVAPDAMVADGSMAAVTGSTALPEAKRIVRLLAIVQWRGTRRGLQQLLERISGEPAVVNDWGGPSRAIDRRAPRAARGGVGGKGAPKISRHRSPELRPRSPLTGCRGPTVAAGRRRRRRQSGSAQEVRWMPASRPEWTRTRLGSGTQRGEFCSHCDYRCSGAIHRRRATSERRGRRRMPGAEVVTRRHACPAAASCRLRTLPAVVRPSSIHRPRLLRRRLRSCYRCRRSRWSRNGTRRRPSRGS